MTRRFINLLVWLFQQLKTIFNVFLHPISGNTHKERLESFYGQQAEGYDDFRKKLLHGREEMLEHIPPQSNGVWIDMGGGTGYNVEVMHHMGKLSQFSKVYIVDLSSSLLEIARRRKEKYGWKNVEIVEGDATTFNPPEAGKVDVITFSYSLTMIPDWFLALEHAKELLKPKGGVIGVVDFYVTRKYPAEGYKRHSWFSRTFWQVWFAADNVNLSPDHLPWLYTHFTKLYVDERWGSAPIVPFIKTPHYIFIGTTNLVLK